MADILVLNDDHRLRRFWPAASLNGTEPRGPIIAVCAAFNREEIDVQVIAGFEELDGLLQLLIETVVKRNRCVAGRPAMRSKSAVLCAVLEQGLPVRASCGNSGKW